MDNNNEDLSFRQDELPEDASLLILDDDKAFLQRIGRAMESRGFAVRMAETVAEATDMIRQSPPAFAVVDMRLEDGNGLEVLAELGKMRPNSRAVVLTGYGNIATAVTAVKLGAVDYLAKPADADEVTDALLAPPNAKAPPPENPMSADRVRWEHIQRVYELCNRKRLGDRAPSEHASAHVAAHPGKARTEIEARPVRLAGHRKPAGASGAGQSTIRARRDLRRAFAVS